MTGHEVNLTGAVWFKSTYSNTGGNCVEVCTCMPDAVAVRDSKDVTGPELEFTGRAWSVFVAGVKHGQFNLGQS
jgi:Domain of unknown function (DUF397)